jgi:predicted ATPase
MYTFHSHLLSSVPSSLPPSLSLSVCLPLSLHLLLISPHCTALHCTVDAHNCDDDTWMLLHAMLGMPVRCTVLTTVTNRTVLSVRDGQNEVGEYGDVVKVKRNFSHRLEDVMAEESVKVFELKGLSTDDVRDLLVLFIGEENVSKELVALVTDVSSGNAHWCKAIANFIIENGIEKAREENYLENSLQFLMFCRLDKFTSVQQLVAKTASIIGFEFSFSVISAIVKSTSLLSSLQSLHEHGFIVWRGNDGDDLIFNFQNEKIRSMLYEITPKSVAYRVHRATAKFIKKRYANKLEAHFARYGEERLIV